MSIIQNRRGFFIQGEQISIPMKGAPRWALTTYQIVVNPQVRNLCPRWPGFQAYIYISMRMNTKLRKDRIWADRKGKILESSAICAGKTMLCKRNTVAWILRLNMCRPILYSGFPDDGINFMKRSGAKLCRRIIEINRIISDRINNRKELFRVWVNWAYTDPFTGSKRG